MEQPITEQLPQNAAAENYTDGRRDSTPYVRRDSQIDNCKFLLIFLMVLGHTFEQFRPDSSVISVLFSCIYVFHMEAFVFLAGYHSKNTAKCRETAVERFFVPYVIFNFLTSIWIALINGTRFSVTGFQLFSPHSTLWFLFALFVWKLLLKDFARVRFALPLSILLGLGAGMFSSLGLHDSLTRIVSFLPFFLAGYLFRPEMLARIRRLPRAVGVGAVVLTCTVCVFLFGVLELPPGILYFSRNYGYYSIGLSGRVALFAGMGLRLLFYILAALMIAALFILLPHRDGVLTKLGRNTMTVYLLHFFLIRLFKKMVPSDLSLPLCLLVCLLTSAALTLILSLPVLTRGYQAVLRGVTRLLFRREPPAA